VKEESVPERLVGGEFGRDASRQGDGVIVRAIEVRTRVDVLRLDDERESFDRREVGLFELVKGVLSCSVRALSRR